ncbi:efflux RND transporter periplasmic adaptor subunit [Viscerimonas tarda]
MKYLVYLLMCSSTLYFSACGTKAAASDEEKAEEQAHEHGENEENIIIFTPEQAENILDFSVETLKPQVFYQVVKASGQILSAPGDEVLVSATMSGIVTISGSKLVEGMLVSREQQLFSVSGSSLSENNHLSRLNEAKAVLENAKSEYERALSLVQENIISQKEYQQLKLAYEQAELNYKTLSTGVSANGKAITSPMNGYVKNILVQSGQYVEIGQALATVTQNKRLVLRADVSQRYMPLIKNVQTASFATPYDNAVYDLSDLNGKLLSFGKSSDGNAFYTPVSFEFDNRGDVVEGSFVEIYLKAQPVADALVLPISALIEEQGRFFVFVQQEDDDDEYLKKEVAVGASDGLNRQILRGLKAGEKVVTKGAYAIKLASLQGAMPEHSHEH